MPLVPEQQTWKPAVLILILGTYDVSDPHVFLLIISKNVFLKEGPS